MSYVLKKIGESANIPCRTFECDNVSDLAKIDVTCAPMGSRCYVINTGDTYALNSNKEWKIVPKCGNPSGPSDPETGDDIIYDGGEEI